MSQDNSRSTGNRMLDEADHMLERAMGARAPDDFEQKLSAFIDALDEWGCSDNAARAKEILQFQRAGYDLDSYLVDHPSRSQLEIN